MTIEKAIEILETKIKGSFIVRDNPDLRDALQMGVEALKRIKEDRAKGYDSGMNRGAQYGIAYTFGHLLPGETEP